MNKNYENNFYIKNDCSKEVYYVEPKTPTELDEFLYNQGLKGKDPLNSLILAEAWGLVRFKGEIERVRERKEGV